MTSNSIKAPTSRSPWILALAGLAFSFAGSPAAQAEQTNPAEFSLTSFNIKYYGLNGDHDGEEGSESRDETIRAHMEKNRVLTDVIVFQEIVDVESLQKNVLGSDYNCRSYENNDQRHQHVVICHRNEFVFAKASDDDNYIIEGVDMGKHRPALHGILKTKSGRKLAHIIGVHLKAHPEFSSVRLEQARIIANYIKNRRDTVPVAIAGDFNTHNDDAEQMDKIFGAAGVNLKQVVLNDRYTYRVREHGSKLDRVWASKEIAEAGYLAVKGPCNVGNTTTQQAAIKRYNTQVSDHCPVLLNMQQATEN